MSHVFSDSGDADGRQRFKRTRTNDMQLSREDILMIRGYGSRIFQDPPTAYYIESGGHLRAWPVDQNATLDRYDVRSLLDAIPAEKSTANVSVDEELERSFDSERFQDLPLNPDGTDADMEAVEALQATNATESSELHARASAKQSGFAWSYNGSVPVTDNSNVVIRPITQRDRVVMQHTAMFLAASEPHMLALLTGKTATNPQFAFLRDADPLHEMFAKMLENERAAKRTPEQRAAVAAELTASLRAVTPASDASEPAAVATTGASTQPPLAASAVAITSAPAVSPVPSVTSSSSPVPPTTATTVAPVTTAVGHIPADVVQAVQRFAQYVVKNGSAFEARARSQAASTPALAFLLPWNQYHAYYLSVIEPIMQSVSAAVSATVTVTASVSVTSRVTTATTGTTTASVVSRVATVSCTAVSAAKPATDVAPEQRGSQPVVDGEALSEPVTEFITSFPFESNIPSPPPLDPVKAKQAERRRRAKEMMSTLKQQQQPSEQPVVNAATKPVAASRPDRVDLRNSIRDALARMS